MVRFACRHVHFATCQITKTIPFVDRLFRKQIVETIGCNMRVWSISEIRIFANLSHTHTHRLNTSTNVLNSFYWISEANALRKCTKRVDLRNTTYLVFTCNNRHRYTQKRADVLKSKKENFQNQKCTINKLFLPGKFRTSRQGWVWSSSCRILYISSSRNASRAVICR